MARKIAIHKHTKGIMERENMGAIIVVLIIKFTHILHMNNIFFFRDVKFNRLTINECLGMLVKSLWIKLIKLIFFE